MICEKCDCKNCKIKRRIESKEGMLKTLEQIIKLEIVEGKSLQSAEVLRESYEFEIARLNKELYNSRYN